jgi:Ca2+-transporting ATPase
VLAPLHIAFLELVIDPACSIVFEAEQGKNDDLMQQAPRSASESLIDSSHVLESVLQGLWVVLLVMGIYAWLLAQGAATDAARTASFVAMVTANAALIFPTRSMRGGWRLLFSGLSATPLWVLGATLAALLAVTNVPVVASAFGFAQLAPSQWLMAFAAGAALLPVFQLTKAGLNLKMRAKYLSNC